MDINEFNWLLHEGLTTSHADNPCFQKIKEYIQFYTEHPEELINKEVNYPMKKVVAQTVSDVNLLLDNLYDYFCKGL